MGILPKIFKASQGFLENEICHAMLCYLSSKFNLEKILPDTIYKKMQPNALLIWQQNIYDCKKSGVTASPLSLFQSLSRMASLLILDMGLFFPSEGCAWKTCSAHCSSLAEVWLSVGPQNFCVRGSILVARKFSLASYSSLSLSLAVIF
jgi:hypothetical protein